VTFTEAWGLLSGGGPVVVGIFTAFVLLQLFSERVAKALGPILGAVGRWWHGREERQERELQALLAARAKTAEDRATYQLEDMQRQLAYFLDVVEKLRGENAQLRDELHTVHRLMDDTRRGVQRIIDTGERLAILPPPPPTGATRRHAAPDTDPQTQRIYPDR
jgi:hypothetical protein